MRVHLNKELREKHKKRSTSVRVGDKVKVTSGSFKGSLGKVTRVDNKREFLFIEGVERQKLDGSKFLAPIRASNTEIIELDMSDSWRKKILER